MYVYITDHLVDTVCFTNVLQGNLVGSQVAVIKDFI